MPIRPHLRKDLDGLDGLIERLPFALDDAVAVGRLFAEWQGRGGRRSSYHLDLWTYCYVRRYFLLRFLRSDGNHTSADLEAVVEQAFGRIERKRGDVRDPARFAHWVVVVCRNTYLSFVARRPEEVGVDRIAEPGGEDQRLVELHDDLVRASALDAALGRLPRYLREAARLKLVEGLEYEVIEERTGLSVPSIRAYVHKALCRLRTDRRFLEVLGYESQSAESKGP